MNETLKTIKARRSIRKFAKEPVKAEDLQAVLEAGIYAPNQQNKQSWHFTVVQTSVVISELIVGAKKWLSKSDNPVFREKAKTVEYDLFYSAPINIIISGDDQDLWSRPNCAAAVQNILLAAESLGLGACWKNMITGLLNSEEGQALKERLGIPAGYRPYFGVVLGYKIEDNNPIPPRKTDCINYV